MSPNLLTFTGQVVNATLHFLYIKDWKLSKNYDCIYAIEFNVIFNVLNSVFSILTDMVFSKWYIYLADNLRKNDIVFCYSLSIWNILAMLLLDQVNAGWVLLV